MPALSWPKAPVVSAAVSHATSASPAESPRRFEEARQAFAKFFDVARREQLLLTPDCTSALALAVGGVHNASGQRVLTSRWEHHARRAKR